MNENELFDSSIRVLTRNLPVLRKMLGLTQSEFADIVGLSRQTVVNIENENQKMKRTTFMAMMYLFSLNRKRADADILLSPSGNRSLVCFGRVLLPARPPLPRF